MSICVKCDAEIPNHIHYKQKYKYLFYKILNKGK